MAKATMQRPHALRLAAELLEEPGSHERSSAATSVRAWTTQSYRKRVAPGSACPSHL